MSRRVNRSIWLVAAVAVLIFGWWEQRQSPARPEVAVNATHAPAGSDATVETTPPPATTGTLADSIGDATERRILLETLALIDRGGPFPYAKDGSVFSNRERRLPDRPRGYYREYTVPTPGEGDRGARRIVKGSGGETWYTRDHYGSFIRLDG
jgi:ribonuclease T1